MTATKKPAMAGGTMAGSDPMICEGRAPTRSETTPIPLPPQRPRELARAPHSENIVVIVTRSKDEARIFVETWSRRGDEWLLGPFTPSLPAVLMDTAIEAMLQARDRRGA